MVLLANTFAVDFSVWMGDRGCVHFISLIVCQSSTIYLDVIKSPANSVSETEDMTTLIIWSRYRTGPVLGGIGSFSEQKKSDPARLQGRKFH